MRLFNKVAIIGVGLIGGSLGMAIKKKGLAKEVIGIVRRKKTILEAVKKGAIDKGAKNLSAIKEADLIILATPVNTIIDLLPEVVRYAKRGTIISDVGSTKAEILKKIKVTLSKKNSTDFIGAHPLAGIEKKGLTFANPKLFEDSLCILIPLKSTRPSAIKKIKIFWQELGCRIMFLGPQEHDRILAFVSHLPHIVAFCLIDSIPQKYFDFASSGLKDTTRLASSDPLLWRDICLTNKDAILVALRRFQKSLRKFKDLIKRQDGQSLKDIFKKAKSERDGI